MATVAHALTTITKVKLLLGITDASNDTLFEMLINGVTDFIESYCGRRFKSTTYTNEVYDARGGRNLFFKQYPVTTLTTLAYRTGSVSAPTYVAFPADDYMQYLADGYVKFMYSLPSYPQHIRATYVAGYLIDFTAETTPASHTLPFDLTNACSALVVQEYNLRLSRGILNESTEGQSVGFATANDSLPVGVKAVLDRYTINRIA